VQASRASTPYETPSTLELTLWMPHRSLPACFGTALGVPEEVLEACLKGTALLEEARQARKVGRCCLLPPRHVHMPVCALTCASWMGRLPKGLLLPWTLCIEPMCLAGLGLARSGGTV